MPKSNFADPEMTTVHSVKILLCYLLTKLDRPVAEEQLLEIAEDSGVINYFYLSEAIEDLLKTGAVSAENTVVRSISRRSAATRCAHRA